MKAVSIIGLTAILLAPGCAQEQETANDSDQEAASDKDVSVLVYGNNQFAVDLYSKLAKDNGNLFFSPFSIFSALGMTYAGARGDTAAEMAKTLYFSQDQEKVHPVFRTLLRQLNAKRNKPAYQLSLANALWGQRNFGFLPDFINLTGREYDASLKEVDFIAATEETRKLINDWVEEKTQQKIKELLKPGVLDANTRLVLTNAIYFKGFWASQFKKSQTQDAKFRTSPADSVTVPMMRQQADFPYFEGDDFQALQLPYRGKDLSMVIFLPKHVDGMDAFEKKLTAVNLTQWLGKLRQQEVDVALPRFKMTSEFSLKKTLTSLGMRLAFVPGGADFTGMSGSGKNLHIAAVVHKAFVDVNEEGTEAAAATAVVVTTKGGLRMTPIFRADHPFVFLIRDNRSGSILFMGRMMNPAAG